MLSLTIEAFALEESIRMALPDPSHQAACATWVPKNSLRDFTIIGDGLAGVVRNFRSYHREGMLMRRFSI